MRRNERKFIKDAEICFDPGHRARLAFNISKYDQSVVKGRQRYAAWEEARQYASGIKDMAMHNLPDYLEEFEKVISQRGVTVLWARDSGEAIQYVRQILEENETRLLVKSKSMVTEEIGFNENVGNMGIESLETDLGEFIVQLAGEKPYHIVTPAMHKSKEDVAQLFHEKFGTSPDASPEDIAAFVRSLLRDRFVSAETGVTGANFIVADIGGIGLTENEGNGLMSVSFPQTHIVIAGIERVIPSVRHLPFYVQWLGVNGTGQYISAYNSLLLGPRKQEELDGPEKMYVILLDNGRSDLYIEKEEYQALKCIRCGSCLNSCPVYKNVGGYTYSSTYSGPIGSVITPFYDGFREFGHLSFACTLCGKCTEVCPVKIPLHELLLLNRRRQVEHYGASAVWKTGMKAFGYAFKKRRRLDAAGGGLKNRMSVAFPDMMGKMKQMPVFAEKSFSQQWKNKKH